MSTINPYTVNTDKKGSATNPYTEAEYESMLEAGTWPGGFVENRGYCIALIDIVGSSSSFDDSWPSDIFGSTEDPWSSTTPPYEGGGGGIGGEYYDDDNTNDENESINVDDILSINDFRGYNPNDKSGCFRRCQEMLALSNNTVSSNEIAMTNYDENGRATNATDNFEIGLNYIDSQLQQGKPVIVSVDYKDGTSMGATRDDRAGDHFVIIVGGGRTNGYHYFDPATSNSIRGTSPNNNFSVNGDIISSNNVCTTNSREYILSGIRKNN